MEIKPEYETFGRDVDFDKITNIKRIFQPSILSEKYFFNPKSLSQALSEICWLSDKEEILVYFRNISGGIAPSTTNKKRQWYDSIQEFGSLLGNNFPGGLEMEYWYGPEEKAFSTSEFKKDSPPYQAFIRLFDNAIQGFSCFVGSNREGVRLESHRSNYRTIKPGESLIIDQKTLWRGSPIAFLESAVSLDNALYQMGKTHNIGISGYNYYRAEIRIISAGGNAIVGSLLNGDSATLEISNDSLCAIVKKHNERREKRRELLPTGSS